MSKITIYTDGASRGNPGLSASGFSVYENNKIKHHYVEYNGIKTNNYAEYNAVFLALSWCAKNFEDHMKREVELYSDSELVVRQLNGTYKVKSADMKELNEKVKGLKKEFKSLSFHNLPREHRGISEVDKSLNALLDTIGTNKY